MHLLVLSAFRHEKKPEQPEEGQTVSMHLLVLSAFRQEFEQGKNTPYGSQCTFWCSVLSDQLARLEQQQNNQVSMHLLVLSAFRPIHFRGRYAKEYLVSMHLLVLSAFRRMRGLPWRHNLLESQCTFWCSVLSDGRPRLSVA